MGKIITLLISVYADNIPIIVHKFHQNTRVLESNFLFQKTGTEFTNYPEYMLIIITVMPEM